MQSYTQSTGNYFIWKAKCLAAMVYTEQGKVMEGFDRMEEVLQNQIKCLGTQMHASLDSTLNNLAIVAQRARNLERAEVVLGMLAQIRREIYGDFYDATVVPLLKLAALQRHQKKDDMFIETCQEGIELS